MVRMKVDLKLWLARIADVCFPKQCLLCGRTLLGSENHVCTLCLAALPRSEITKTQDSPMKDAITGVRGIVDANAVFSYVHGNDVAHLVHEFKYHGYHSLAVEMGRLMYDEMFRMAILGDYDAIVPVPLHWTRLMKRGYNQTECLCRGLSGKSGWPVENLLKARRHGSQTRRSGTLRRVNPKGKYYLRPDARTKGRHFLLIDDVFTTGSTILAAAEALLSRSDCRVTLLTFSLTNG